MRASVRALAVGAVAAVAWGSHASAAQEQIIESYSIKLDRRCHVAIVRAKLSTPAPVGIKVAGASLVGRVPFGPQRSVRFASASSVTRVFVWDLSLPDGRYLKPGRYTATLRAFDKGRKNVLDRSRPLTFRIPRSFASPPTDCGS